MKKQEIFRKTVDENDLVNYNGATKSCSLTFSETPKEGTNGYYQRHL